MSRRRPIHPTSAPDGYDRGEPRQMTRNIPPLVWIVLAALLGWLVVALVQQGGTDRTPQGVEAPRKAQDSAVMPAAPSRGAAPATPGVAVNPRDEPAR